MANIEITKKIDVSVPIVIHGKCGVCGSWLDIEPDWDYFSGELLIELTCTTCREERNRLRMELLKI